MPKISNLQLFPVDCHADTSSLHRSLASLATPRSHCLVYIMVYRIGNTILKTSSSIAYIFNDKQDKMSSSFYSASFKSQFILYMEQISSTIKQNHWCLLIYIWCHIPVNYVTSCRAIATGIQPLACSPFSRSTVLHGVHSCSRFYKLPWPWNWYHSNYKEGSFEWSPGVFISSLPLVVKCTYFMLAGIILSFQGVKIKSWFIDGHCVLLENDMNKLIALYYYLKSFERK